MRRSPLAALALLMLAAPATAEPRAPKPYTPVAITLPAPPDDPSFATFRTEFAAVAKGRIYGELARLVRAQGFFWDRDFGRVFDARKPAVDNLAAALALEHRDGSGWVALAGFAAETAVEPLESRPGVVCAPARPAYDGAAYARLLDTTYTGGTDWAYPRGAETPVRAAPQADAAVIATLGRQFVLLLGFEGTGDDTVRTQWARVATPDARIGYAAPGSLQSLTAARLCYLKDMVAGWRIAGYVNGGN